MAEILGINDNPSSANQAANKNYVDGSAGAGGTVPVGTIVMLAHTTVPANWRICDGAEISQSTYSALYAILGSSYNTNSRYSAPAGGNFRIPDLRDVFPLAMNPSGPVNTTTLGTYLFNTLTHTHSQPTHSHGLATHTHPLAAHNHLTGAAHDHTVNNHTHTGDNHTHTWQAHTHTVPGHYHNHNLSISAAHTHRVPSSNTGTTQSSANIPRSGNAGSGSSNVSLASTSYNVTVSPAQSYIGVNPATVNGDAGGYSTASNGAGTTGATAPTLAASNTTSGSQVSFNVTTLSTANSGGPSVSTTNTDGSATSGASTPPYLGVYFIIKVL